MHARRIHLPIPLLAAALGLTLVTDLAGCRGCQREHAKSPATATDAASQESNGSGEANGNSASPADPSPAPTPEDDAVTPQPIQQGFRERSVYEMEQTLGKPLQLRQDAINAAYTRVGWAAKHDPTSTQDHRAYAQGLAWGFDIRTFIRRGRAEPFRMEELADHPLEVPVVFAQDDGASAPPRAPRPVPSAEADEENEARDSTAPSSAEIARIKRSLADLNQSVEQVEKQIEWAQQQLQSGARGEAAQALRDLLLSLDQTLRQARSDATREEQAIEQLSSPAN